MVRPVLPMRLPPSLPNLIGGKDSPPMEGSWFDKVDPHDGRLLLRAARSGPADVDAAVLTALDAQPSWAATPGVERGRKLHALAEQLERSAEEMVAVVSRETGKSPTDARGEVAGAVALGRFFAGEGQRLFGRTMPSGVAGRLAFTVRDPVGVAGLVVPANTPIANVAWKVFPALICGNAAVVKSAEDAPGVAHLFGLVADEAGLPPGVLAVVHGLGVEAGSALVKHPAVDVVSFTGSTTVGRAIAHACTDRLAKVSLELGGQNALVVLADADLDRAVHWAVLSAFSNAGQRCAAASRLLVEAPVYEEFCARMVAATQALRVGPDDADDLGPVITERAVARFLDAIGEAVDRGARLLCGGTRLDDDDHIGGFYVAPTVLDRVPPDTVVGCEELFGPVTTLAPVTSLEAAIDEVHASSYGLTAAVHTRDFDRAMTFVRRVRTGVVSVNGGTYGSEPHMPFGGTGLSGNGTREPGTEALDVYSSLKTVYLNSVVEN